VKQHLDMAFHVMLFGLVSIVGGYLAGFFVGAAFGIMLRIMLG
jgi:hypothetical protein